MSPFNPPDPKASAREAVLVTLGEIAQCALGDGPELGVRPVALAAVAELAARLSSEAATAGLPGLSNLADLLGWGAMRPRRAPEAADADALCTWAIACGEAIANSGGGATNGESLDLLLALGWLPAVPPEAAAEIRLQLLRDRTVGVEPPRPEAPADAPIDALTELAADEGPAILGLPEIEPEAPAPPPRWIQRNEKALLEEALTEQVLPVALALGEAGDGDTTRAAADTYRREWGRLCEAFAAMSLTDLTAAGARIEAGLVHLSRLDEPADPELLRVLAEWPIALLNYFHEPTDLARARDLAALLADPALPSPLSGAQAESWVGELISLRVGDDPAEIQTRKSVALAEDVELTVSPDVLPSVLEGMLQELPGRTHELARAVQLLVADGRPEQIDIARRTAHTLKGDSNIVGVAGIANLTHALEEIFLVLAAEPGVPVPELASTLLEAADVIEMMSDHVLGRGAPPENAVTVLQRVLDWDNKLHADPPAQATSRPPLEPSAAETPAAAAEVERPAPVPSAAIAVPAARLDQLLRATGEAIIYSRQIENRAERVQSWLADVTHNVEMLQTLATELQQIVEARGASREVGLPAMGSELDALELDRFNELHTVTLRLVERIADTRATGTGALTDVSELKDLLVEQDRVHLDLQGQLLETLSVPVASLTPRFARLVRQVSRMVGKDVELTVSGESTLVDSEILERLAEPLAHILRNAVDHGIESPAERREAGKPERGRVALEFSRDADLVTIRCRDDGRGLDDDAIRDRAVELGLLAGDARPSPAELEPLIFRPGFSTRSTVDQISGRGLGMEIVQASINRLKGSLSIRSEPRAGCEITLTIPVSQILANVLLVDTILGRHAVTLASVERLVELSSETFEPRGAAGRVLVDGEWVEAVALESRFTSGQRAAPAEASAPRHGLLTKSGTLGRRVVLVDGVGDARRVIVKNLGPHAPSPRGVLGATILGDGTVAPVFDLGQLLQTPSRELVAAAEASSLEALPRLPSALVVDDSLSMRRSLEHALTEWGFEVVLAHDGLEAVQRLAEQRPDVLLVDLEMPRMNGLELTSYVRNQPELAKMPVIMITTRTTHRHRDLALEAGVDALLTKPFSPDELRGLIERRLVVGEGPPKS